MSYERNVLVDSKKLLSLIRVFAIILLSVGISSVFVIHADNPSPVGWNLSGGGFCQGTYTIFNTTLSPNPGLYAENCSTGKNDCYNASDLGVLMNSCILPTNAANIVFRAGFFAVLTTIIVGRGGVWIHGSDNLGTVGGKFNGTWLVEKSAGITMLKASSSSSSVTCTSGGCVGAPTFQGDRISDLTFFSNQLGGIGMDFRMAEIAAVNRFDHLQFVGTLIGGTGGGFTTDMFLDGNEDAYVEDDTFNGDSTLGDGSALVDLQWQVPTGNINVVDSFFGGQVNIAGWAQNWSVSGSTIAAVKVLGSGLSSAGQTIFMAGNYMANGGSFAPHFNLNGFTVGIIRVDGDIIFLSTTQTMFSGAGALSVFSTSGSHWIFNTASTWNPGAATLTKQVTGGDNHVAGSGGTPTGFPFSIDGNNNF